MDELKSKHELHPKNCRKFDVSFTYLCDVSAEMKQEIIDVLMKDGTAHIE